MKLLNDQEIKEFLQKFDSQLSFDDAKLIVNHVFNRYKGFYVKGWEKECPLNTIDDYIYFCKRMLWRGSKEEALSRYKWDTYNDFETIVRNHNIKELSTGLFIEC